MTVQVSVRACTVGELAAAAPELSWMPVRTVDDERDEPDELSTAGLGELDDRTFRRVRAALPREPGLYLWTTDPAGAWTGRTEDLAVLYLGRATGAGGLQAAWAMSCVGSATASDGPRPTGRCTSTATRGRW